MSDMSQNKASVLNLGKNPTSTVMKLAWPTILEQLIMSILTIVDTAMVGALGSQAAAAVGIVMPVTWLLNGISASVSTGFSVVTAQNIGGNNMKKASLACSKGIFFSFILGLFVSMTCVVFSKQIPVAMGAEAEIAPLSSIYFAIIGISAVFNMCSTTCSSILRSCGQTKTPLIVNSGAILVNLVLNYLLIFESRTILILGKEVFVYGAGLGVAGAAIGTLIAIFVSFVFLFIAVFKNRRGLNVSFSDMPGFDSDIYKSAAWVGVPIALERMTISAGQLAYMRIISTLGTTFVATHHLANQAESLSYLPCFGFSVAATTLVGQAVGAKNYKQAEHFGHIASKIGTWYGILIGLVLFFLGEPIMMIFSQDPEIIKMGSNLLKIVALGQPFQAATIIYSGGIRGTGESRAPFLIGLSGIWGIRIVLCLLFVFVFDMKLYAAWVAMVIDMAYRGVLTAVCFVREFKKKYKDELEDI